MITTNFYGLHNSRSMVKKKSENQYLHVLTNSLSNTQENAISHNVRRYMRPLCFKSIKWIATKRLVPKKTTLFRIDLEIIIK